MDRVSKAEFKEINHLIDAGLSDKDIAHSYGITERTVYAIRRNRYDVDHWRKQGMSLGDIHREKYGDGE